MRIICKDCDNEHSGTLPLQLAKDLITGIERILSTKAALQSFDVVPKNYTGNIEYVFFTMHKNHKVVILENKRIVETYLGGWRVENEQKSM